MEHFDLVEKLVNTFGVSYEEARNALEKSGWDPVNAAVILERAKNGIPEPETPKAESTVKGKTARCNLKEDSTNLIKTVWDFLNLNEFVVKKSTGEVFLDIPLWLFILLLCAFFWAIVVILGVVFLMGYRFSFKGPQLGGNNVKNTVDRVESVGEEFVEKVKKACSSEEDTLEKTEDTPAEETINLEELRSEISGDTEKNE